MIIKYAYTKYNIEYTLSHFVNFWFRFRLFFFFFFSFFSSFAFVVAHHFVLDSVSITCKLFRISITFLFDVLHVFVLLVI